MDEGLFAAEGIDLRVEDVTSTDAAAERVKAGTGQVSTSAMEQIIIDRDAGGSLLAVAGNVNKLPFSLIAQPSIRGIAELRGKTIGVSSLKTGTSAILTKLFAGYGLQDGDYKLVAVGPIDARWQMLKSGEIDAGLQGIPQNLMAIDAGFSDLGDSSALFPELQFASFTVDQGWAEANRHVLVRFLRAMLRAFKLFHRDAGLARRVAMRHGDFSADYADRAWQAYTAQAVFPRDGDINMPGLCALIELSAEARELPARRQAAPERYIDRSYLLEARSGL
jgi:ABC-type nitrate/sulfonate/bicarbonate transport system substrate-binding protein